MRFYNPANCEREDCDDVSVALRRGLVPSVTSILSVIRYEHLETWYIKKSLERYCATGDMAEAVAYRDTTAADFGTACHSLVEAHLTGNACTVGHDRRHQAAVEPLLRWLDRNVAEVVLCEAPFADSVLCYGGTADMLLRLTGGRLLLADVKCKKHSRKYPMQPDICYKYQLSAYRHHFSQYYGEMSIANFLLASPFGWTPQPYLLVCDYGSEDWMDGFNAALRLWMEQHGGTAR